MENIFKRVIRWILGWYIDPIATQCIQSVSELKEQQAMLQKKLGACETGILERQEQLSVLEEFQKLLEVQRVHITENTAQIDHLRNAALQVTNNILEENQQLLKLEDRLKNLEAGGIAIQSRQMDVIYAYRYLLNREPESQKIIERNTLDWHQLRESISDSAEYRAINGNRDMPCFSLIADEITYFYKNGDCVIPGRMGTCEISWGKDIIEHFIKISDQYSYGQHPPCEGWFLDVGGNIGTTSIYCKLKVKPELRFLAFEPVTMNAKLFAANAAFNGITSDIQIEQLALSNQIQEQAAVKINRSNWGNSHLITDGPGDEQVVVTTLDTYLTEHEIAQNDIKYIWIDVEGHEPEVLEGAALLYQGRSIPTCLEFNQSLYMAEQKYEKMLALLEEYFTLFVVCERITEDNVPLRSVSELGRLWEELDHRACDLILI